MKPIETHGNRNTLSLDERYTLEERVLPTAKEWLRIPALRDHGLKTLEYWGEPV